METHDFLVVVGDTGSGKTTQLPAYLIEADAKRRESGAPGDDFAPVAITQPRRVAATSVSRRVADERKTELGGSEVGYKVRFDSVAERDTKLTFMTDGVLVRECVGDGKLARYKTVMLDEAHERSVDTDVPAPRGSLPPTGVGTAAAATRIVRGDAAPPRPRREESVESRRRRGRGRGQSVESRRRGGRGRG